MKIKIGTLFIGVIFVFFLLSSCNKKRETKINTSNRYYNKPNIIIIYSDDVGYADTKCYGGKSIYTPNIDQLAKNGVRFTDAHAAAATCTPSRYSILTGRYAWRKKGTGVAPGNAPLLIDTSRVTLPEVFQHAGYQTAAIGKWHLGLGPKPEGPKWNGVIKPGPLELGFDYCFIIPATPDRVPCVYVQNHHVYKLNPDDPIKVSYRHPVGNWPTGKKDPQLLSMKPWKGMGHKGTIVNGISRMGWMTGGKSALWTDSTISNVMTDQALHFIRKNRSRPFFLYFASHDIHVPRVPNQRFRGKSGMGPRGDEILELDWEVGRIMKTLDSLKIARNTLIVFSSDNGPILNDGYMDGAVAGAEHPDIKNSKADISYKNMIIPGAHNPAGPLRGGKYSNFEGGTRVPFIVYWPGHTKKGLVSHALISQVDLLASFAVLTHQKLTKNMGPDGFNMLPVLLGKTQKGRKSLVEEAGGAGTLSLVQGNWKYIRPDHKPNKVSWVKDELGNSPQPQLYDLKTDLGERRNLASQYPEKVKEMAAALNKIIKDGRSRIN